MTQRFAHCSWGLLFTAALVAGCSRDPVAKAAKYIASGDAYVAKQQLPQAQLEYRNAIKARPDWAEPHYKLAKTYEKSGEAV